MMRIREMEDSFRSASRSYVRVKSISLKTATSFAGLAVLCLTCFYLGSVNNANKLEVHEIDAIKNMLESNSERSKRSVGNARAVNEAPLLKRLEKRSASESNEEEVPLPVIRTTFDGGVTYTRWGRRDCPSGVGSKLVYSGIAAGSHYTHTGGGSNILCMSYNVTYEQGKYIDAFQDSSYLYGVEYRVPAALDALWDYTQTEGADFRQHAMPCAICMGINRLNQLMIPGTDKCPAGWSKEYEGYILSNAHGHKSTGEYVCVDDVPHVVPGSGGDQAGVLLYMVETTCPSLQCEPYVHGREVRCVVCTI